MEKIFSLDWWGAATQRGDSPQEHRHTSWVGYRSTWLAVECNGWKPPLLRPGGGESPARVSPLPSREVCSSLSWRWNALSGEPSLWVLQVGLPSQGICLSWLITENIGQGATLVGPQRGAPGYSALLPARRGTHSISNRHQRQRALVRELPLQGPRRRVLQLMHFAFSRERFSSPWLKR